MAWTVCIECGIRWAQSRGLCRRCKLSPGKFSREARAVAREQIKRALQLEADRLEEARERLARPVSPRREVVVDGALFEVGLGRAAMTVQFYAWRIGDVFTDGIYRWAVDSVHGEKAILRSCGSSWATTIPLTFSEWHEGGRWRLDGVKADGSVRPLASEACQ